jgi:hypothetical protein
MEGVEPRPTSPLGSRIAPPPRAFLDLFTDAKPTLHNLTADERRKVEAALTELPALHRRVLAERLRSLSFVDGMPNTALTYPANPGEAFRLYDITVRAGVLRQNVSEFLTEKELTCFDTTGSSLTISVDAGSMDAIVYVLLHEAAHVVDGGLRIAFDVPSGPIEHALIQGVWTDRTTALPQYRHPLLESTRFHAGGRVLNITDAEAVYSELGRTPFFTLYSSSNWHCDFAELVTWRTLTQNRGQPYRVLILDHGEIAYAFEPTGSALVQDRFELLERFFASQAAATHE